MRLLAAADARRRAHGLECSEADRDAREGAIAAVRAQLDVATADAVWSDGTLMTLEEAIAYAREQSTEVPPT